MKNKFSRGGTSYLGDKFAFFDRISSRMIAICVPSQDGTRRPGIAAQLALVREFLLMSPFVLFHRIQVD